MDIQVTGQFSINSSSETEEDTEHGCRDTTRSSGRNIYCEEFEYTHSACYLCNGYYGPCFDEPVCATCHAFLFPGDLNHAEAVPIFSEKTDDGDSGNDEPADPFFGGERRASALAGAGAGGSSSAAAAGGRTGASACGGSGAGSPSGEGGSRDGARPLPSPPTPPPPPARPHSLEQRLHLLSSPRPPDDVDPGVVECLPPEVLLAVFSYLDDLSLWSVGHVCKRWRHLVQTHVAPEQWRAFTLRRWPLFKPLRAVGDWFQAYSQLMASCPCKACLQQMALQSHPPGEENSWRRNRLRNELKSLRTDPPEGIEAEPLDAQCCHWQASITGPVGSPYEGGLFYLYLQVPYSYPMCPPAVRFLTRIFHPNVSRHGDVGIDSIQHNWSLALTISKVLISVQSLLTDPYCMVCMEPGTGDLYLNDRKTFESVARAWTWRYAMPDILPCK